VRSDGQIRPPYQSSLHEVPECDLFCNSSVVVWNVFKHCYNNNKLSWKSVSLWKELVCVWPLQIITSCRSFRLDEVITAPDHILQCSFVCRPDSYFSFPARRGFRHSFQLRTLRNAHFPTSGLCSRSVFRLFSVHLSCITYREISVHYCRGVGLHWPTMDSLFG
jgi:hypothetical protein